MAGWRQGHTKADFNLVQRKTLALSLNVGLGRTNRYTKAYHRVRVDTLADTTVSRLAIYQVR